MERRQGDALRAQRLELEADLRQVRRRLLPRLAGGHAIQGVRRSVFNLDISRDGKTWERKYRFETPHVLSISHASRARGRDLARGHARDHGCKERIMFGKLEDVGQFESQAGQKRIEWPPPLPEEPAIMKPGVKLFTDREYVIDELPGAGARPAFPAHEHRKDSTWRSPSRARFTR